MTEKLTFETARIEMPAGGEVEQREGSEPVEVLDRYELRRQLNKGGFATVHEAYDPRIKRRVAIKKCSSLDAENHERFFREAEIAGNLSHPNIVRIFDFGVADGVPFIVQELLGGKDLADWIESGLELSRHDRVRILYQIARGLEYAHAHDVIHRDIKPANVRVLEDGSIKLLDFGVAAIQQAPSDLTQTGATVGTAAYLAPEQIRGERPSHATDMFSFGVLGYELLSGHRPFEGETLSAILYQIAHDDPEPLQPGAVPRRLVRLVHRCLEKLPEHRFSSFEEISALLEEILRDPRLAPPSADTVPIGTYPRGVPSSFRPQASPPMEQASADGLSPPDLPLRPSGARLSTVALDGSKRTVRDSSARIQVARPRPRRAGRIFAAGLALIAAGAFYIYQGGSVPEQLRDAGRSAKEALPQDIVELFRDQFGGTPVVVTRDVPEPVPDLALARALDRASPPAFEAAQALDASPVATRPRAAASGPATLFLPPSWHPKMAVSVNGGPYETLDRRRTSRLRSGTHVLDFRLVTASYRANKRLTVELDAGETRTLESPLAPPAGLRVRILPETLGGGFEIDGKPVDLPLTTPRVLQPGIHELVFFPAPSDPLGPLAKTVDLRSATAHLVTFDMRRRKALLETREVFEWQDSATEH